MTTLSADFDYFTKISPDWDAMNLSKSLNLRDS
jgi:hypothetical protein